MILPGIGCMAGLSKSPPQRRGSVQSDNFTLANGESRAVTLAAHEAGDVIAVIIAARHSASAPNFDQSVGWTTVIGPDASTTILRVLRRTATTSSESLTLTNNTSGGEGVRFAIHSYAIDFAFGSVTASNPAATASRNPPSLSPSWDSETNLWIAANLTEGTLPATPPTGFANGVQTTQDTLKLSTADISVEAPTLDPGAFEGSAGATDISLTIAVRPE